MSEAIGVLRARVTLQSPQRVADEIGGAAILWTDEGEAWAAVEAAGVSESAAYNSAAANAALRLTINRRDDVRAGWRVFWGARVLRIEGVADDGAPRVVLQCVEERL
ncbi:MAG: phage head closure protein [Phycisphaerales bacterium]|nr:phage head closure protein [Hyphomonadaceae bacterium]